MAELRVSIVRFVDPHQPGFVEVEFEDADGRIRRILDKVSIFTEKVLDAESQYPQAGSLRCAIQRRWRGNGGRDLG
jgi:hypothetical protein